VHRDDDIADVLDRRKPAEAAAALADFIRALTEDAAQNDQKIAIT